MIFRLEYCNKESVAARVDIQKGLATPVYAVEGTDNPFILFYNNDKGDKSGSFRSSGADINIYETAEFNIDELKTSNETEISVKYYINNILNWSGFVIPDFFSETITGGKGVVSMVASDRLGTLKGATLSGLSAKVSNRELTDACLAQTGLSLPLYTMADFTGDGTNIFNSEVLSQRMVDTKGRNVSCYDILSSILEETNSLIVQRNGAWYIVNKLQLEAGVGSLYSSPVTSSVWVENTVSFDEVSVGARRTIKPVAATVGVYHEHGGGRLHPDNYDFSLGVTGWTSVNGFVATTDNREIELYSNGTPIYGDATSNDYLVNNNERVSGELTLDTAPYLESASIPVVSTQSDMVDISIDVSITAPGGGSSSATPSFVRYAVIASNGTQTYALNRSGTFEVYDPTNLDHSQTIFIGSDVWGQIVAVSKSQLINGKLEVDLTGFNVKVRIYGSGTYQTTAIHFASIRFSNTAELPKGNIFKTTQGANYTKDHDIKTVLWGDYLTSGLNGYFYDYPIDDTSSLYRPTGELHSGWTAYGDPDTLPLLQHITRQKSRMFSVAHDLLSADIKASNFDPLSIFVDCDSTRYVVVSARFDFLRSNVSVELEEIAYATNSKRDYIYSYFGDGEEGIRSIGGISGGTGGGGGVTHTHANKAVIDKLTQLNIDVLSYLSLHQTGVEMEPELDEYGQPVLDVNGNPVMVPVEVPVLDELGRPVLDVNGDPVTEQIPVYAIKSTATFFSEKEVSAYGLGEEEGGGGGGGYDMLISWANYTEEKSNWVISAALGKGLHDRVTTLEAGGVGGSVAWADITGKPSTFTPSAHSHTEYAAVTHAHVISDVWGLENALSGKASSSHSHGWSEITDKPLTFTPSSHGHEWSEITDKPSTFDPAAHGHSMSDITGLSNALAAKFDTPTGTTSQYVRGNGSLAAFPSIPSIPSIIGLSELNAGTATTQRTVSASVLSQWLSGKGYLTSISAHTHAISDITNLSSTLNNLVTLDTAQTITGAKTFSAALVASVSVSTPKVIFSAAGWSLEQSGTELQMKYNGTAKMRFLSGGSIVATQEITAYS